MTAKFICYTMIIGCSTTLIACSNKGPANQPAQDSARSYPAITLAPQKATLNNDYPAAIQGIQNVEIRPKIDGYVDSIFVDEGVFVHKGQLLFRISAPQYEENVKTAEANIKIALADVDAARMQVDKVKPLVEQDIVSDFQLKSAQYTLESRLAALAQARAALSNANTNLGYTMVRSPADGMLGILPFKVGSLVNSNTTNPLTTVSNITQIFAYFSINEREGLDFFGSAKGHTLTEKMACFPPVQLVLANGYILPVKGRIEAASGLINPQTGALNLRATFDNANGLVRSGSSAVVRMPVTVDTALLVPQKATYQLQGKLFVYIVDTAGLARPVELTAAGISGLNYVVKSGVKKGDIVIADGVATLREGAKIKPAFIADSTHNVN